jgi:hypothetical protein
MTANAAAKLARNPSGGQFNKAAIQQSGNWAKRQLSKAAIGQSEKARRTLLGF